MRSSPHNGVQLQERLDVLLTTAAFDQHVALLFLDDGVFQLKKGQNSVTKGLKDTASIFKALEIYDVNDLYIEIESLQDRGLKLDDLDLSMKALYRRDVNGLMEQHDVVISA